VSTLAFRKASDVARQAPALRGSRRAALTEQVWVTSPSSSAPQGRAARVCMVTRRQELPPVGAGISASHDAGSGSGGGAVTAPEAPRCASNACPMHPQSSFNMGFKLPFTL